MKQRSGALLAPLLLLAAWPAVALAQVDRSQPDIRQGEEAGDAARPVIHLDFEFAGGSLVDYLDALRASARTQGLPHFNVVISDPETAARAKMPEMSLQHVDVDTAMDLIQLVGSSGEIRPKMTQLEAAEPWGGLPTVTYVLNLDVRRPARPAAGPQEVTASPEQAIDFIPLADLVGDALDGEGDSADAERRAFLETVLTAVETAFTLRPSSGGEERPTLKYHADSRLLFVVGTEEDIALVTKIVDQVAVGAMSRRETALAQVRESYEKELEAFQERAAAESARSSELRASFLSKVSELEERLEKETLRSSELQAKLARAEASASQARAEKAALQKAVLDLQSELEDARVRIRELEDRRR